MLAPDGRALLLDALRPPAGYELGRAVATTFTLDLTAALVVPLAFATSQLGRSKDPVAVMEAVRSCTDRVDLFCQAGSITLPRQASELVEFVGPMVHEVRRPRPGHLFHPKVWALRFESGEADPCYRILVLSRNLTLDRGWDLVLCLDDDGARKRNRGNDQLVRLLAALPAMATTPLPAERAAAIAALAQELRSVNWELPDDVADIRFWAYGLGRTARPDFSGYRQLVVSPFLTDGGLDTILGAATHRDLTLVSRSDELDRLGLAAVEGAAVYSLDPLVGYGDAQEAGAGAPEDDGSAPASVGEQGDAPSGLRDLHAKLVVIERSKRAHVFVGSANATDAAFAGNVEVLCELDGGHSKLGVATILDAENGMGALLVAYQPSGSKPEDPADELRRHLEEALRAAAEVTLTATAAPVDDRWTVELRSDHALPGADAVRFTVAPLNRPSEQHPVTPGAPIAADLGPREAADITAFYILTGELIDQVIRPMATVVRATLVNDPAHRLDDIVARQVDTPEKFLRFLLLLLGLNTEPGLLGGAGGGDGYGTWLAGTAGVLELLTTTLATRPRAIDDLAGLVERLQATPSGRAVLPDGWDDLWAAVLAARTRVGDGW